MDWPLDNDRPIYIQLVELIERALVVGTYPPGGKLPGVRELAFEAGVNPNTMQRAMAELETKGLLYTQRTSGRFVTQDETLIAKLREHLAITLTSEYLSGMQAIGCNQQEILQYVQQIKEESV